MPATLTDLEQALQRYGDELYRLALLLAPDEAGAAALLIRTAHSLAARPVARFDEPTLFAALADAMPPERRRRRLPSWARPPVAAPDSGPLLAQIARLPDLPRLALGLAMLPGGDPEHVAPAFAGDMGQARAAIRDALLALAPVALPDHDPSDFDSEEAPAGCQPIRAALALASGRVHDDPALRGHLALCDGCRAVERAWQDLYGEVEQALRSALRELRMPAGLASRLRAALGPQPPITAQALLADTRTRLGLVALAVFLVIALLVLPGRSFVNTGSGAPAAPASPRELLSRAASALYAPPPGSGVWHGRWEMRWAFPGGNYAPLVGDLWIDTTTGRHRVQLVHQAGGGPYEFELADGVPGLWYATSEIYGSSLYPLVFDKDYTRVHIPLSDAEQRRMLQERLNSGAWGLAAIYLRQAESAPELRGWGRQQLPDGTMVEVIGFRGVSPLALPPDAPDAISSRATILLMIEPQSGVLREVRELLGPEDGEQSGRVTWRFVRGEWVGSSAEVVRIFDRAQAWNGIGAFAEQESVADPALPLIQASAITPLARGITQPLWMPTSVPTNTLRAALVDRNWRGQQLQDLSQGGLTSFYIGAGRRLAIWTQTGAADRDLPPASERVVVNGKPFGLQPSAAQGYRATLLHQDGNGGAPTVTWISAFGYTRAELLDLLSSIDQSSVAAYYAQAHIFAGPAPSDPAAFEALLQALRPGQLPPGTTRHYIEQVFARQKDAPDPLHDPYHLPPYHGWPAQVTIENWARTNAVSGTQELVATTHDGDGAILAKQYLGSSQVWYYDAKTSVVTRFRPDSIGPENRTNSELLTILRTIDCGNGRLSTLPDGTRAVSSSIVLSGSAGACGNIRYEDLLAQQAQDPLRADAPYLQEADPRFTTWIYLGADGRATQIEVRSGANRAGVLIESWKLMSDEYLPEAQVPAGAFDASLPQAQMIGDYTGATQAGRGRPGLTSITLLDALKQMPTPVFIIPNDAQSELNEITSNFTSAADFLDFGNLSGSESGLLWRGILVQFSYSISNGVQYEPMQAYEGPAEQFGAYLRARVPSWQQSDPIQLTIDGRTLSGWRLNRDLVEQAQWVAVEVDGTLLLIDASTPAQNAAIGRLHRVDAP